jgi:hypothetical protein
VSWAALNGRSFHLVAGAGKTGAFVLTLVIKDRSVLATCSKYVLDTTPSLRVSWNLLATVIGVSELPRRVRLYKRVKREWNCIKDISSEKDEH